jgi:hypothetical protein
MPRNGAAPAGGEHCCCSGGKLRARGRNGTRIAQRMPTATGGIVFQSNGVQKKAMWLAVASGATALTGAAVRRSLDRAWRFAMDAEPPDNPAHRSVSWREAVLWTVATGVVIGLGQLLARRGAAAGWHALTGEDPPE